MDLRGSIGVMGRGWWLSFEMIGQKGGDYVRSGGNCRLGYPVQTFDKRNWEGEGDGPGRTA
jgi:hypothetical protein